MDSKRKGNRKGRRGAEAKGPYRQAKKPVALRDIAARLLEHSRALKSLDDSFNAVIGQERRHPQSQAALMKDVAACEQLADGLSRLAQMATLPPEEFSELFDVIRQSAQATAAKLRLMQVTITLKSPGYRETEESRAGEVALAEACRTAQALLDALPK